MKLANDKNLSPLSFNLNKLKFESTFGSGLLFPLDLKVATLKHHCPYCFRVLYEMRNRPFFYCKAKNHKKFFIHKDKLLGI